MAALLRRPRRERRTLGQPPHFGVSPPRQPALARGAVIRAPLSPRARQRALLLRPVRDLSERRRRSLRGCFSREPRGAAQGGCVRPRVGARRAPRILRGHRSRRSPLGAPLAPDGSICDRGGPDPRRRGVRASVLVSRSAGSHPRRHLVSRDGWACGASRPR
jgi:hypothetical protein